MPVVVDTRSRGPAGATLVRCLAGVEESLEWCAPFVAVILVLLFAVWFWFASRGIRFQFDELLELSAATAPSNSQVVSFLAAGVDFNPPLSHFLVRASVATFGNSEWAARLPAFLGMIALLVFLCLFVSRQVGRIYGLVAIMVVLCLPVRAYAVQARPYGLLLGLTALSLVLYRVITLDPGQRSGRQRAFALGGLAVCTAALVSTHYYAFLVVAIMVAAGLVRGWERRKLDWPLLVCCGGPPFAVLFLLRHVILQQRNQLTHYFARGSLMSFDHGYDDLLMDPLVCCLALLLTIGLLTFYIRTGELRLPDPVLRNLPPDEMTLALGLLLLPLLGAVATQFVTHAYLTRYFVPASVGLAMCVCYGIRTFAGSVPGLAVLLLIPLGLGFGKAVLQEAHRAPAAIPSISVLSAERTPILFDTPEAYMQSYHYLPAMRNALWVIADPSAALRYRQYDTDDRIMLAIAAQGRAQAISLSAAVRRWPSFRLVPRTADYIWALKCVMDAGAQITVKQAFDSSDLVFSVKVKPEDVPLIDACGHQ